MKNTVRGGPGSTAAFTQENNTHRLDGFMTCYLSGSSFLDSIGSHVCYPWLNHVSSRASFVGRH
jgi:hypothetical protein